jgi:hypothetical protein
MIFFLIWNFSFCLESATSPPPFNHDPFDSLRKNNFSDEEFERCFRFFDSHKYGVLVSIEIIDMF